MVFQKVPHEGFGKAFDFLSISFLLIELQNELEGIVPISGLLAIISMGVALYKWYNVLAVRLSSKYNKLWVAAEILLFVLVGATVDLNYVATAGLLSVCVVVFAMMFRMAGVFCCLLKTKLDKREASAWWLIHQKPQYRRQSAECHFQWVLPAEIRF